jgi:hypothetical protein
MFGGGGEELALQEFAPGTLELVGESRRRLEVVRRALVERPALAVEIEGGADPEADAEGVRRRKLERLLRQVGDENAGSETAAASILREDRAMNERQREAALRVLFERRFPSGAVWESSMLTRAEDAAPQPRLPLNDAPAPLRAPAERPERETQEERRGLLGRTWDLATLKGARDWWGSRRERREAEERAEEEARRAEQERARLAAEAVAQQQAKAEKAATVKPVATVEEMERYLLASIAAEPGDLTDLARARAQRVRDVLLAEGNIAPDRVRIAEAVEGEGTVRGPQARLHLR